MYPALHSSAWSAAKWIAAVRLIVVAVIPYIYFVPDIVIGSSTTEHTENLVYVLYVEGSNQLTHRVISLLILADRVLEIILGSPPGAGAYG